MMLIDPNRMGVGEPIDPDDLFDFREALKMLFQDSRVRRSGWNGKGMWLRRFEPYNDYQFIIRENQLEPHKADSGTMMPWIGIKTANNQFFPWTPSQEDMQAEDWMLVPYDTELRLGER